MLKEANVLNRALAQALADHIGSQDRGKSSLDTFFGHEAVSPACGGESYVLGRWKSMKGGFRVLEEE